MGLGIGRVLGYVGRMIVGAPGALPRRTVLSAQTCAIGVIAAVAAVTGPGCATERDPINRVELGALPKAFFVGEKLDDAADDPEFYFRTTVVDVSAGAGAESLFTNSDAQPTVRVRFEITQDKLLARLAYELVEGTDGKGTNGPARNDEPRPAAGKSPSRTTTDGQIVAAFKIEKHFDIRRTYNAETGEETNVIVENDTDRPFNQREYVRVDWSTNLITDAYDLDAASQLGLWGGVTWSPIAYSVREPESPDAPALDVEGGYLDVTNKAYASPQMVHDPEWGDFPACLLVGSFPRISCNPSEVKLRLAFRRVADTDYEALDYDGGKMDRFGYFTNDRYGYDRRYGVVDEKWHRFASRWNLWDKSHASPPVACNTPDSTPAGADPHRDVDADGTEDECTAVGNGSRCDTFKQACTIPIRERKVRTIPWHVNRDFPEDLFPSSKKVIAMWSDAMRVAILSSRLAECRRTKSGDCEGEMGWPAGWSDDFVPPLGDASLAEVPAVFVLCHNPVDPEKGDDPACGEKGLSPRIGDLRHNLFTFVVSPQAASPWGIMVDAEDPLTGEKIAGSVNQWGGVLDRLAAQLVDLVDLLNGVTSPEAFIEGKDVSDWVKMTVSGANEPGGKAVSSTELAGRLGAFDPKVMAPFKADAGKPTSRKIPAPIRHRERMKVLSDAGKLGPGNTAIAQRLGRLRGSSIEAQMITPEIAQLAGVDPKAAVTASTIERATPFAKNAPLMRRAIERRSLLGGARRHSCKRAAPDTDHILPLARKAQKLFGTVDPKDAEAVKEHRAKIYQWARESYSASVFSHEFGHAVGLRHNFAGTFDSLNYDEHYWQLRTKNGSVTNACASGTTDGSACIGPRYSDPITAEERDGGINGFASSSVMDYPGDQALDMFVMGKYDRAAVRFGYGGVVDVWAGQGISVNGGGDGQRKAYELTAFNEGAGLFGVYAFPQPGSDESKYMHYSQYASAFGLISGCKSDPDSPTGSTCRGAPMDVVDARDMKDFAAYPQYASFLTSKGAVDPAGRPRRGYMFSSDEYANSGNVPAFSYDAGADAYEQIRFLESAYENRYLLDSFRRGRTSFNSYDVLWRVQAHYLDTIQLLAKTFAFAMVLEVDDPTNPAPQLLADGNYGPLATGTSVAFDVFTHSLTRPEPGSYCSTASDQCPGLQPYGLTDYIHVADPYPLPETTPYDFKLPLGVGRYVHNDFDYAQGYWWADYQKQVGSFYDKIWSFYYLSEAFDSFISNSKDDFIDGRYKNVNFATIYPRQTARLFGALVTGDIESYAPWAGETSGGGVPSAGLVYPEWHLANGVGTRPVGAKIIDPAFGWNEQLYAMVWGTMFFPTTWSNQFIEDARITALASEQLSWPAAETYTFVDPVTSMTYRAHTTGTEMIFGVAKEKSLGARMLEWANNLVYSAYVVETTAGGDYVLNPDGTPKLKLVDGKPQLNEDYPGADVALKRYVANIDVMRQLVSTFVRPIGDSLPNP